MHVSGIIFLIIFFMKNVSHILFGDKLLKLFFLLIQ